MRAIDEDITFAIIAPQTSIGIVAEQAGNPGATFIDGTPLALTFRPHGRKFIIVSREDGATIDVPGT